MKNNTLEMLDRLIREVPMGLGHLQNLVEAREAVAGLIGMAESYRMAHKLRFTNHAKVESGINLDTALARITGAI